jgi:outer membrane protein insertion porin family
MADNNFILRKFQMGKNLVECILDYVRTACGYAVFSVLIIVLLLSNSSAGELDYGLKENRLAKIEISGNAEYSDKELKAILRIKEPRWFSPVTLLGFSEKSARYRPDLLDIELKLLIKYYRRNGFHDVCAEVDTIYQIDEVVGDLLKISIVEGPKTIIDSMGIISDNSLPKNMDNGLQYVQGVSAPADLNNLGPDIYMMSTRCWEEGLLKVSIEPVMEIYATKDSIHNGALLIYRVNTGKIYTVSEIRISGNELTQREIIENEIKLSVGEVFKWSAVEDTQLRLLGTSLFRDVSFKAVEIDTSKATVVMEVAVIERKPSYIEFGLGIGSRERVRVLAAWGNNNIFGNGQKLRLKTRTWLNYEDVQQLSPNQNPEPELNYRYELTHTSPRVLDRLRLATSLFFDKETRGESGLNLQREGVSLGTRITASRHSVSNLVLKLEEVEPTLHPDAKQALRNAFEGSELEKSGTRSIAWNYLTEKRDNPIRPSKGSLGNIELETAGGALGGDNSFVKGRINYHSYKSTFWGGVLASRISAGVVRPYSDSLERGADGVPYQERFFAGGVSTVRGYQERSLGPQITDSAVLDSLQLTSDVPLSDRPARGGNYLLLTNVEWRVPLPVPGKWKLGGVLFVDGGNVWEHWHEIRLRSFRPRSYPRDPELVESTKLWDYRWSYGAGLRFDTPVGPVRFDVGFPLKRAMFIENSDSGATSESVDDRVIYHFSLGFPF